MFAFSSPSRACKRKLRAPQLEIKAAASAFSVFGCTGAMISYSAQEKYPTGTSDERLVVIITLYPLLIQPKKEKRKKLVLLTIIGREKNLQLKVIIRKQQEIWLRKVNGVLWFVCLPIE